MKRDMTELYHLAGCEEKPTFTKLVRQYVQERFGGDTRKLYRTGLITKQQYSNMMAASVLEQKREEEHRKGGVNREMVARYVFALRLNEQEAGDLYKAAGYSLSRAIRRELVYRACIRMGKYELSEVNAMLAEWGCKPLK